MAKKTNVSGRSGALTGMCKALALAHNEGNTKAITKDFANGAGADKTVFAEWVALCEIHLYDVVANYVTVKKNSRWDAGITADQIEKARSEIFPVWKAALASGEEWRGKKRIAVNQYQVEDLIGFCWKFVAAETGTAEALAGKQVFRKLVESLIGCEMAKTHLLTEKEADTLKEYQGACRTIDRATDRQAEIEVEKRSLEKLIGPTSSQDFADHIRNHIRELDAEYKKLSESIAEATEKRKNLRSAVLGIQRKSIQKIDVK